MVHENGDITYREWAPNAEKASLIGDFSERFRSVENDGGSLTLWSIQDDWDRGATPMKRNEFGVWEICLPANDGQLAISHNTKVKVCLSRYMRSGST